MGFAIHNRRNCDTKKPFIFVSYASQDKEVVLRDVDELRKLGANIWVDTEMKTGNKWTEEAFKALSRSACKALMLYVSEYSLTSENVLKELEHLGSNDVKATHVLKNILILPILLDENVSGKNSLVDWYSKVIVDKYEETGEHKIAYTIIKNYLDDGNILMENGVGEHNDHYYENLRSRLYDFKVFTNEPEEIKEKEYTKEEKIIYKSKQEDDIALNKTTKATKEKNNVPTIKSKNDLIVYKLYGQKYSGNQSDLMYNVFDKVIERHPDKLDDIVNNLYSVSFVDYENKNNVDGNMKTQFRICKTLKVGSRTYCVGESLNKSAKFNQISKLLNVCGEDQSVLEIYEQELPVIKTSNIKKVAKQREIISTSGNLIDFTLYGDDYKGNQSDMMLKIFENVIRNNPDKIKLLHDKLTAVSLIDKNDNIMKGQSSTFNTKKVFDVNGKMVCVGTNFGINAKLSQISKLLNLCDEEQSIIQIEGYKLPNVR